MRDEKEGRKKQARSNKQQGKTTQHTQGSHWKISCLGWDAHVYVHVCTRPGRPASQPRLRMRVRVGRRMRKRGKLRLARKLQDQLWPQFTDILGIYIIGIVTILIIVT